MLVGLYGTIPFMTGSYRTQTFYDMRRTHKASFKAHEIHLQKPVSEYVGPGMVEISFSMNLSTRWGLQPQIMLAQLHRYLGPPAQAAILFIGGRLLGPGLSLFVITDLDESHKFFSRNGVLFACEVNVKMTEYQATQPQLSGRI